MFAIVKINCHSSVPLPIAACCYHSAAGHVRSFSSFLLANWQGESAMESWGAEELRSNRAIATTSTDGEVMCQT